MSSDALAESVQPEQFCKAMMPARRWFGQRWHVLDTFKEHLHDGLGTFRSGHPLLQPEHVRAISDCLRQSS